LRSFTFTTIFLILALFCGYSVVGGTPWESEFGTYWAATRLLISGLNPYDPATLREWCTAHGIHFTGPLHPPPFTVIMLAPFAALPFHTAARAFFTVNLIATALSAEIARNILGLHHRSLINYAAPALFLPSILPILFGQTSSLVTLALYAAILSAMRDRWAWAGALLGMALLKPHLWSITGLYFLIRCPADQRSRFICGGLAVLAILLGISTIASPDSLTQWLSTSARPLSWIGASPISSVRLALGTPSHPYPQWPIYVAILAALVVAIFLSVRQKTQGLNLRTLLATLCLSAIFAPYLFFFDLCVLLVVAMHSLERFSSPSPRICGSRFGFLFLITPWVLFISGMWAKETGIVTILGLFSLLDGICSPRQRPPSSASDAPA
jgi:hypothetical protein